MSVAFDFRNEIATSLVDNQCIVIADIGIDAC